MSRVIVTFLAVALAAGCSGFTPETDQSWPVNSPSDNRVEPVETPSNNLSDKDIKDLILESCRQNRLVPLTTTGRRGVFELRLWTNIGLLHDERLLIVRSSGSRNQAGFYHLRSVFGEGKFQKAVLVGPISGWSTLQSNIKSRLDTPDRLMPDPQFYLGRDEGLIYLEVVENGEYRIVYYGQHSKFDDAVRLKDLCRYLSDEFGLDIDCLGERTILGPIR